ncbi:carbohydrate kinase family protein [Saccharomonospora iraqiensis]|uniref:carbohydrate kinase family protein n=1 Tax=Saccharomonospora iraqiensis TaxID=52698 RepID=UPI00022E4CD5|nr:carbohydrate kinase [Saccharomonospora iraqiensis]
MLVSAGEALVDLVPAGAGGGVGGVGSTSDLLAPRLGGGPYNVALAAGRLGAPTAFLSRLSTDRFGDALLRRLEESGVDTSLVRRGPEPTSLAVVTLDDDAGAEYRFYVEGTADRLITDPGPLPPDTTALSVGTLGMVLDPGARAYEAVLRREHDRGVLTALDPNIRPGLIADPAAYRARFAAWLPSVRLLKLSIEDADWLAGGSGVVRAAGVRSALRSWLDAGPAAVVLTAGADGLSVITARGHEVTVPTVAVEVGDTIGAGDTVQGAMLAWFVRHGVDDPGALTVGDWRDVLSFAARAAAVTVSRRGAEPPTAAEMVPSV